MEDLLFNKENEDLYGYYDIDFDNTHDFLEIFIDKLLYSNNRKLYNFRESFNKFRNNNTNNELFHTIEEKEEKIIESVNNYILNNMDIVIDELLIFLEDDYNKKKYKICNSIKLGLIMNLFKYENFHILNLRKKFKVLQEIGINSIEELKSEINKEEWVDYKKRIKALTLELNLFKK